jgi:hypothetical protein
MIGFSRPPLVESINTAGGSWQDVPPRRLGVGVLVCLLLLGLTHIGVLGAAMVMLGFIF